MTVSVSKSALNLREELSSLKKPSGIFGEQILRANTSQDFYSVVGNNRNLLINGDFRVAQRGATFSSITGSGTYHLDRWQGYFGTGQIVGASVYQSTDVPATESFKNSLKITLVSATNTGTANGYPFARQIIEDFSSIIGSTSKRDLTLSFWAKSSVNMTMSVDLGDNETNGLTAYLTPTWKYYTLTYPKGSAFTFSAVDFQNASSAGDIYITGVQLEFGRVATPFEYRLFPTELALCQRYFTTSYAFEEGVTPGTITQNRCIGRYTDGSGQWCSVQAFFPVRMRASPSITIWGVISGATSGQVSGDTTNKAGTVIFAHYNGFTACTQNVATGNGESVRCHYTASAEL